VKALPALALVLLSAAACTQINTGATPASPADTFACMTQAVRALGYTITTSQPGSGFLAAERVDPTSPDSSEFSELSISVYKDRDGHTRYQIQPGRTRLTPSGAHSTAGVMVLDMDNHAADVVAQRCGKQ